MRKAKGEKIVFEDGLVNYRCKTCGALVVWHEWKRHNCKKYLKVKKIFDKTLKEMGLK